MKDLLLSLGWVDKGDILVRYTDPRIGWKPEDGTLIIGYREWPEKVNSLRELYSLVEITPHESARILRRHNEWRRYDGPIGKGPEMLDVTVLGKAIDVACDALEAQNVRATNSLTWQDIKRIIDIEGDIYKDAGNLSHEVFKKYPAEEAFYTEILKRFND